MRILFSLLLTAPLWAQDFGPIQRGYTLLDRICIEVEGEAPILESEIKKRAKSKEQTLNTPEEELINERLLWVLAKKQLKFSVAEIESSAYHHAEKVMKDNKLTKEQFNQVLMRPPYEMSFEQYLSETKYAILKNQVEANLASQVAVTDEEIGEYVNKSHKEAFDVVFISVLPTKKGKDEISSQLKKAKELSLQITATTSLDQLKKQFKGENNVVVVGPITYQKGSLKSLYDQQLARNKVLVTEPFIDEGAATVIWKIKKSEQKLDENALEKVREDLYKAKVIKNFTATLEAVRGTSTVTTKGCSR